MTIREEIINIYTRRIQKLQSVSAPSIMIKMLDEKIEAMRAGKSGEVGHMKDFGELVFTSKENKVGRGGKPYISFQTEIGTVNFFPMGTFGPFLTLATKQEA